MPLGMARFGRRIRNVSIEIVAAGGQSGQHGTNQVDPGSAGGDGYILRFDVGIMRGTVLDLIVGGAVSGGGYSSTRASNHKGGSGGGGNGGSGAFGGTGGQASAIYVAGSPWAGAGGGGGGGGSCGIGGGFSTPGQTTHAGSGSSVGGTGGIGDPIVGGSGGGGGGITGTSGQQGGIGGAGGGTAFGGSRGGSLTPSDATAFTGSNNNSGVGTGGPIVGGNQLGAYGQNGRITITVDGVQTTFNYTGTDQSFTIP